MPSKYTTDTALPLRVTPELREDLDALVRSLPRGVPLSRNAVAVAAIRAGLASLREQLGADPFAVHRALAASADASTSPDAGDNGGTRAPGVAPGPSRPTARPAPAGRAKPAKGSTPARAPSKPRAPRPAADAAPIPADAPSPDAVRELLATVLDRDRDAAKGSRAWSMKALSAALSCDRRALQTFRADGSGVGRALQLRLWDALRGDPPIRG